MQLLVLRQLNVIVRYIKRYHEDVNFKGQSPEMQENEGVFVRVLSAEVGSYCFRKMYLSEILTTLSLVRNQAEKN